MKWKCIVLLSFMACASTSAGEVEFDGKVTDVTVYTTGKAKVIRTGKVKLGQGRTVLLSDPLPNRADPGSVLVRVGGVKIESVETRRILVDEDKLDGKRAEYRKILQVEDDKLFELKQKLIDVTDKINTRNETLQTIANVRLHVSRVAGAEISVQKMNVENWANMVDFAEKRAEKAHNEVLSYRVTERQLRRTIDEAQRRYDELAKKYPTEIWETRAYIMVNAATPVEALVAMEYTVGGADWEPSYRVTADLDGKRVEIELFGSVSQRSGEEWKNINLSLSTARTDLGTDVPTLTPWYLRTNRRQHLKMNKELLPSSIPQSTGSRQYDEITGGEGEQTSADMQRLKFALNADIPSHSSEVLSSGAATVFTAESKADIPSDGYLHKIPVSTIRSAIEIERIAIPKVLPHAFIHAKTVAKAPFALLPGVSEVVVGNSFIGRGMIRPTAPGEPISLGLGIDENVKIELKLLDDKVERQRRGDRVSTTNAFEIKMTSYSDKDIELTVIDQIPVSKSGDVKVNCGREARRALRGARFPGQLKWTRVIKPREIDRIEFDFTIEYPEHLLETLRSKDNLSNTIEVDEVFEQNLQFVPFTKNKMSKNKDYHFQQNRYGNRRARQQVKTELKF